jgi:hypothetical protein
MGERPPAAEAAGAAAWHRRHRRHHQCRSDQQESLQSLSTVTVVPPHTCRLTLAHIQLPVVLAALAVAALTAALSWWVALSASPTCAQCLRTPVRP